MTAPDPPKGWEVATGVWGTDVDRSESVYQAGSFSLHMLDTAVATEMHSPWFPVEPNLIIRAAALVQTDDITAGNILNISVDLYLVDKTTLSVNKACGSILPAAVDTWQWFGGFFASPSASARWGRVVIDKAAVAFNAYWDQVIIERYQPGFYGILGAAGQSIPSASWNTITFTYTSGDYERFPGVGAGSPGVWVCTIPGHYFCTFTCAMDTFSDGTQLWSRIRIDRADGDTEWYYGSKISMSGSVDASVNVNAIIDLVPGDQIRFQVWHNEGSAVSALGDAAAANQVYRTHVEVRRFARV